MPNVGARLVDEKQVMPTELESLGYGYVQSLEE
jgi:hypothetical protein